MSKFKGKSNIDEQIESSKPENWRNARNIIVNKKTNSVSNEDGFSSLLWDEFLNFNILNNSPRLIGSIPINDDFILFTSHIDTYIAPYKPYTQIGIVSKDTYSIIVSYLPEYKNTIQGKYTRNFLNERIIAWWDGIINNNPPCILNIDNLPFDVDPVTFAIIPSNFYNKMKMFPDLVRPAFDFIEYFKTGGNCLAGVYWFTIQYKIGDNDFTNCIGISQQLVITQESELPYVAAHHSNNFTDIYKYNVSKTKSNERTTCGVKLKLTSLSKDFTKFRLIAIRRIDENITSSIVGVYNIDSTLSANIIYSGQKLEDYDVGNVLIPTENFKGIKTGTNLNDKLIAATVRTNPVIDYQKFANAIKVNWNYETLIGKKNSIDIKEHNDDWDFSIDSPLIHSTYNTERFMTDSVIACNKMSLRPNEVYDLYIHLIRNDGTDTEGYHIPGRQVKFIDKYKYDLLDNISYTRTVDLNGNVVLSTSSLSSAQRSLLDNLITYFNDITLTFNNLIDIIPVEVKVLSITHVSINVFDFVLDVQSSVWDLASVPLTVQLSIWISLFENTPLNALATLNLTSQEELNLDKDVRYFHTRETVGLISNPIWNNSYPLGYWENLDEYYPDDENYDIWEANGSSLGQNMSILPPNNPLYQETLKNKKVRHHHTPKLITVSTLVNSTYIPNWGTLGTDYEGINTGFLAQPVLNQLVNKYAIYPVFNNIQFPDYIKQQIKGFYFSYAKRNIENRTVIATGMMREYDTKGNEEVTTDGSAKGSEATSISKTARNHIRFYDFTLQTIKPKINPRFLQIDGFIDDSIYNVRPSAYNICPQINYSTDYCLYPPSGYTSLESLMLIKNLVYDPRDNSATFPKNVEDNFDPSIAESNNDRYLREECVNIELESPPKWLEYIGIDSEGYIQQLSMYNRVPIVDLKQFCRNVFIPFNNQTLVKIKEEFTSPSFDELSDKIETVGSCRSIDTLMEEQFVSHLKKYSTNFTQMSGERVRTTRFFTPQDYTINWQKEERTRIDVRDLKNNYNYNNIFNSLTDIKVPRSIDITIKKAYIFENRIIRSNPIKTESIDLGWRTFLVNSYYDMPKTKGAIWNLGINDDSKSLIISMENSTFLAELKDKLTNVLGDTYLGVGDIFDRPPLELIYDNNKYAGCQSQWACFSCKHGYFFVDKKAGKLFLLKGNQITELSSIGYYNFFKNYSNGYNSFENSNYDLRFLDDNPAFQTNGFIAEFDEKYNRILITNYRVYYDVTKETYVSEPFTISYSFDNSGFVCFHDYFPNLYLRTNSKTYLLKNYKNTYPQYQCDLVQFVDKDYGQFFKLNTIYPYKDKAASYIDVPFVFNTIKKIESTQWITQVIQKVQATNISPIGEINDFEQTVSAIQIFTHNQTSGIISLKYNDFSWFEDNTKNIYGIWNFNKFIDILSSKSGLIFDIYGSPIIDANQMFALDWFDYSKFISKFAIVRFFLTNADNKQVHLINAELTINDI